MAHQFVTRRGLVVMVALVLLTSMVVSGQRPTSPPAGAPQAWTPARTAWGDPDLQGTWTNFRLPQVSFGGAGGVAAPGPPGSRPPRLYGGTGSCIPSTAPLPPTRGGGAAAAAAKTGPVQDPGSAQGKPPRTIQIGARPGVGFVKDPPDGRLPPVTPEANKRLDDICASLLDSYVYIDPWVRCITRGVPGAMFPSAYNNAYQIAQIPGYVVIVYEMIHDIRVIPMDGRPRLNSEMRLWMGNPRGRWEGNTLVVETTNFTDKSAIRGYPHSDQLHVVERFTRVDADTLQYETTVTDPKTWTRPWTAAITLDRDADYEMVEYSCHEGNYDLPLLLGAARADEKAAATAK
jgi:hypothetical protein